VDLAIGLQSFQSQFQTQWGMFAAASIMVTIPVLILFLYSSKWLISGLTLAASRVVCRTGKVMDFGPRPKGCALGRPAQERRKRMVYSSRGTGYYLPSALLFRAAR